MRRQIVFFHGGGSEKDFNADSKIVSSLKQHLGQDYNIHYPLLPEESVPDFGRRKQIVREISNNAEGVILVAHSLGASMLLACISEGLVEKSIGGMFLLATPFWKGNEDWVKPFKLQNAFEQHLDRHVPLHFYHCVDDDEVPLNHMAVYKRHLPWASFHEIPAGGHQFNEGLAIVADNIKATGG